jgi:hypothetical protein
MTASEPSGEQPSGDDTALLTAALDHAWTWYDERSKRAIQAVNYYIVATAVLFTAYTNAIGKYWGVAAAIAGAGIVLTLISAAAAWHEADAAFVAERPLKELQDRIADKLKVDSIRMARYQAGSRQRHTAVIIMFGSAALLDIAALVYAATR